MLGKMASHQYKYSRWLRIFDWHRWMSSAILWWFDCHPHNFEWHLFWCQSLPVEANFCDSSIQLKISYAGSRWTKIHEQEDTKYQSCCHVVAFKVKWILVEHKLTISRSVVELIQSWWTHLWIIMEYINNCYWQTKFHGCLILKFSFQFSGTYWNIRGNP